MEENEFLAVSSLFDTIGVIEKGIERIYHYLLKNKLVDKRFVECDSTALYFNDNVADHFWELSKKIVHQISESLAEDVKEAFDSEVFISNDNGNA